MKSFRAFAAPWPKVWAVPGIVPLPEIASFASVVLARVFRHAPRHGRYRLGNPGADSRTPSPTCLFPCLLVYDAPCFICTMTCRTGLVGLRCCPPSVAYTQPIYTWSFLPRALTAFHSFKLQDLILGLLTIGISFSLPFLSFVPRFNLRSEKLASPCPLNFP